MNKLMSCSRHSLLVTLAALALIPGVRAQGAKPVHSADFIVTIVNSEPVTNSEVQAMRNRMLRELKGRGAPLPPEQQLTQQALDMLINEKAQLQLAQEQGIKIDDDQVDQAEANVAANNQISREAFHKRLAQEGLTVAAFRQQLRNQLTLTRLREREVDGRIRITEQDIDLFLKEQAQGSTQAEPPELNIAMILVAVPETVPAPK